MEYIDLSDHFAFDGFKAFISYRQHNYSKLKERKAFTKSVGYDPKNLVILNQVHSKNIQEVNSACLLDSVDGTISKSKKVVLSILVADCIPLFLFNPISKQFGLIHSGWRGAAQGICSEAIIRMKNLGDNTCNIMAVIGPSIGQCCFEVGPEVASQFSSHYSINGKKDRKMLDLKKTVEDELCSTGLKKENIFINKQCTYCEKNLFYSYRREGDSAGRMLAICGWQ